jgi:hypothetical protein
MFAPHYLAVDVEVSAVVEVQSQSKVHRQIVQELSYLIPSTYQRTPGHAAQANQKPS